LARIAIAPASAIAARRPKLTDEVTSASSSTTFARVAVVIARRRVVVTVDAFFVLLIAESVLLFAHAALVVVIADTMVYGWKKSVSFGDFSIIFSSSARERAFVPGASRRDLPYRSRDVTRIARRVNL